MFATQLDIGTQARSMVCAPRGVWLITHFQIKADGKMPYERLRNRAYHGEVVEFAETVHHKGPAKDMASDEHYITSAGVKRCRSIWRRPEKARWMGKTLDEFLRNTMYSYTINRCGEDTAATRRVHHVRPPAQEWRHQGVLSMFWTREGPQRGGPCTLRDAVIGGRACKRTIRWSSCQGGTGQLLKQFSGDRAGRD